MGRKNQKIVLSILALLVSVNLSAQFERRDSLVRLIKAKSLELIEKGGRNYRKSVDATFLHNGTYLICDTALWDLEARIINAQGHVKVVQNQTILTSDKMDYIIDEDMVQCRGTLVQLQDKDRNTLRTHYLDYNTRDSLAFFSRGGAMRSKDGQLIESVDGSYSASTRIFSFENDVNMYTDTIFVRTNALDYESIPSKAVFKTQIDFWKDGNMLSAQGGWYNRPTEVFFFKGHVHAMSEEQEAWSNELYYYRATDNILMLGNVQVQDTTRNVTAIGEFLYYQDSLSKITLRQDAAVALQTKEDKHRKTVDSLGVEHTETYKVIDTLYFGADTLIYQTIKKCDIPESEIQASATRFEEIHADPVLAYRQKAAQEAAEKRKQQEEQARKNGQLAPGAPPAGKQPGGGKPGDGGKPSDSGKNAPEPPAEPGDAPHEGLAPLEPPVSGADSLSAGLDSLGVGTDSLSVGADSLAAPADTVEVLDTTKIGFMTGVGNVKIYRKDLQAVCDSVLYCDLDSIARFYIDPVVWNDGNRQYSADSMAVLVSNQTIDRASLMSNAFIITQETDALYDQIRSTEVMAYFDSNASLRRFDALGGATALFYLKEKDRHATANKVECKMLSAYFVKGDLDRIYYFDAPKNDAFPIAQMKNSEKEIKGFNWQPERQPKSKEDVTTLDIRPSERRAFERHPRAKFAQTEVYFPGYMKELREQINAARRKPKAEPKVQADTTAKPAEEAPEASEVSVDSLEANIGSGLDTLKVNVDSLLNAPAVDSTEHRELTRAELREIERQKKQEAREAKWAVKDARDAAKAEAKAAKKAARRQAREAKLRAREEKRRQKEEEKLARYVEKYREEYAAQKAEEAAKAEEEAAAKAAEEKAASEAEAGPTVNREVAEEIKNIINNGSNSGQISEVHEGGHSEQRGLTEPALDGKTVKSTEPAVQGTE